MEQSILKATKKVIGLDASYTAFDEDVLMHLNGAFGELFSLGVVDSPYEVEDDTALWSDVPVTAGILQLLRTYIYLWVRQKFDPPNTSFAGVAMKEQIEEIKWRMHILKDVELIDAEEATP